MLSASEAEAVYLDSSGIVKRIIPERESGDLDQYLRGWPRRASSALVRTEVVRAVRSHGAAAVARAREVLATMTLIEVTDVILHAAAELDPLTLRSLEAIHIATAMSLRGELARLVTYDERMASAARALGIGVDAPGR